MFLSIIKAVSIYYHGCFFCFKKNLLLVLFLYIFKAVSTYCFFLLSGLFSSLVMEVSIYCEGCFYLLLGLFVSIVRAVSIYCQSCFYPLLGLFLSIASAVFLFLFF